MNRRLSLLLLLGLPLSAFAQRPQGWLVKTDGAAADSLAFDLMPPGWHVTTRPAAGAVLYHPSNVASGRYALALDAFLFPGTGDAGYGVFFGGADLEGAGARWLAFLARRDGRVTLQQWQRGSARTLIDWTANDAVIPHPGGDQTQRNSLRVSIERDSIRLEANGKRITALARGELPVDGTFGLRVGPDLNLHISNLDFTQRLAPAPRPK
jgi:hypothetical protein